jgi:phospholipid transport system substrate-binding protein
MSLRLLKYLACASLLSLAAAFSLRAADPAIGPAEMLKASVDEVLAIAYDQTGATTSLAQRVRPLLEKNFNFEAVTRRAIGPGWRQFTPEQRTRTVSLFTEVVIRSYADKFEIGERPGITYAKAVVPDPKRPELRELPTTIDYAGKKYSVLYRVEQAGDSWRIYDVIIEGVSMIANWRSQLDPIYQRSGADGVIAALEKNLSQPSVTK